MTDDSDRFRKFQDVKSYSVFVNSLHLRFDNVLPVFVHQLVGELGERLHQYQIKTTDDEV